MPIIENVTAFASRWTVKDTWSTLMTGAKKWPVISPIREGVSKQCPLSDEKMEISAIHAGILSEIRVVSDPPSGLQERSTSHKDCTYEQFPDPIVAWKIAGLPKPTTEVFAYIEHEG